jgi:hypothetical protein
MTNLFKAAVLFIVSVIGWHNAALLKCLFHARRGYTYRPGNRLYPYALGIERNGSINVPYIRAMPFIGRRNALRFELLANGRPRHAIQLAKRLKCPSFTAKLNSLLQRPFARPFQQVKALMLTLAHDFKVLRIVVQSVFVLVVNYFFSSELAPENALYNNPMLKALSPNAADHDANKPIARFMARKVPDMPTAAWSAHFIKSVVVGSPSITASQSNVRVCHA